MRKNKKIKPFLPKLLQSCFNIRITERITVMIFSTLQSILVQKIDELEVSTKDMSHPKRIRNLQSCTSCPNNENIWMIQQENHFTTQIISEKCHCNSSWESNNLFQLIGSKSYIGY